MLDISKHLSYITSQKYFFSVLDRGWMDLCSTSDPYMYKHSLYTSSRTKKNLKENYLHLAARNTDALELHDA